MLQYSVPVQFGFSESNQIENLLIKVQRETTRAGKDHNYRNDNIVPSDQNLNTEEETDER